MNASLTADESLIFSVVPQKNGRALSLESFYDSGCLWYADYVVKLDNEQDLHEAIKTLCDAFPFCTQDADDPFMLHVDHQAAHAALLHQYREACGMYAKLAADEYVPYGFEYAAELAAACDDYGLHVLCYAVLCRREETRYAVCQVHLELPLLKEAKEDVD